ncbi:hypothetical protein [Trueperella sp. LYQ143]|uniref:hypothetical protein n=1 Tax=unclassified Trueperella TaxID=2630174 RepID=UPI003983469A
MELPVDHLRSTSTTQLYRAPSFSFPGFDHHVWYHVQPHEVPTMQAAIDIIRAQTRLGIQVFTFPAVCTDADPHYCAAVMEKAQQRGVRILVHIPVTDSDSNTPDHVTSSQRHDILNEWISRGAVGVDLGEIDLTQPQNHEFAQHQALHLLQAEIQGINPDAIVSLFLRGPSLEAITAHALEDYVHVLRYEVTNAPSIHARSLSDRLFEAIALSDAVGALPSWNCSGGLYNLTGGRLSASATLLMRCFLPGILHFHEHVEGYSPSTRHALRIRHSLNLYRANMLIDDSQADDGFIWLITDPVDMLINFGPYDYHVPNDGRVLVSSMIALPQVGNDLVIPPGEVAWRRRDQ